MLYLFYGTDVEKVRNKAFEWVAKARAKEPNLTYVRIAHEELNENTLYEAAQANSLFAKRTLTLIDDPYSAAKKGEDTENEEDGTQGALDAAVDMLAASENAIIILAPKLPATQVKKLETRTKVVYRFDAIAPREDTRGFNAALVNALAQRSREKLWLEIIRAFRAGDAPEMLHGLLHWEARKLMGQGGRAWKPTEARTLSLALISLLQDARRTGHDLTTSLERFALSL